MNKKKTKWNLSEEELDILEDAVADDSISRSVILEHKEDLEKGNISVSELKDIWSDDDEF